MQPQEKKRRQSRKIVLPFWRDSYNNIVESAKKMRAHIDRMTTEFPELLPKDIADGYEMKDRYQSIKLSIGIRRILINNVSYTIYPSFAMPYATGYTDDVENVLFLRKFNVPFWALERAFGKSASYWYRMESALGGFNLVATTVRKPEDLPKHILADEKHSRICGEKAYVPTVTGEGCILGAGATPTAGEKDLEAAYGVFKSEARQLDRSYSPMVST